MASIRDQQQFQVVQFESAAGLEGVEPEDVVHSSAQQSDVEGPSRPVTPGLHQDNFWWDWQPHQELEMPHPCLNAEDAGLLAASSDYGGDFAGYEESNASFSMLEPPASENTGQSISNEHLQSSGHDLDCSGSSEFSWSALSRHSTHSHPIPLSDAAAYSEASDEVEDGLSDTTEDISKDEEDAMDIHKDPLFQSREDIFSAIDEENDVLLDELPPAFHEDVLIRNAYINVFIAASVHHATHELVAHMLESEYHTLKSVSERTGTPIEGLEQMA